MTGPGPLVLLAAHVAHGVVATPVRPLLPAGATSAAATAPTVSAGHLLLQLVIGLAVVVGAVMGAKRLLRGRAGGLAGPGGRGAVRVLGRHALGKGVSVAVVQFGDQAYLVGVTPQSVRRLAVTDAARLAELDAGPGRRRSPGGPGDSALLRSLQLVSPGLATRLTAAVAPGAAAAAAAASAPAGPAPTGADAAAVLDLVPVTGSGRTQRSSPAGNGHARPTTPRGDRPAPTWTSAIEHLRERTVRRA